MFTFYKPTKYKQTPIGQVPEGWRVQRIIEVADTFSGSTPSRKNNVYWSEKKIPWLKSGELGNYFIYETEEKISEKALTDTAVKFANKDTLLVAMYGATAGKVGYTKIKTTINQAMCAIVPKDSEFNSLFGFYFFIFNNKLLISESSGGAQSNINQDVIKNFKILLPPLPEQHAIAGVLSQIDEAIEKVEESINKWKRIKKAAMRKLFSEGIEHREFKYVEGIGKMPKTWKLQSLYQIAKIIMGQSPPSSSYNGKNGVPFLQGNAEFGKKFPNHSKYTTNPTKIVPINSILISVRAPVGDINIANRKYCIGRGLASIVPTGINNNYLFYLLSHLKPYIQTRSSGSTFKAISKDDLKNLHIPTPMFEDEQKQIAGILEKIDRVIELKEEKKKHLEKAKRGAMKLLLTGQVRIRVQ